MGMFWENRWSLKWRARGSEDDQRRRERRKWRRRARVLVWRRKIPLESAMNEICVYSAKLSKTFTAYFVFPGTALETRIFTTLLLVLEKRFSRFAIKMLNFQNACFVYKRRIKSEDGYQIGRDISPDTRPAILYHVMHFSQWECKKVNMWVIIFNLHVDPTLVTILVMLRAVAKRTVALNCNLCIIRVKIISVSVWKVVFRHGIPIFHHLFCWACRTRWKIGAGVVLTRIFRWGGELRFLLAKNWDTWLNDNSSDQGLTLALW